MMPIETGWARASMSDPSSVTPAFANAKTGRMKNVTGP